MVAASQIEAASACVLTVVGGALPTATTVVATVQYHSQRAVRCKQSLAARPEAARLAAL